MSEKVHKIKQKVWHYPFWKWLALILLILWLFCIFFKCCDRDKRDDIHIDDDEVSEDVSGPIKYTPTPFHPNPIDTNYMEILPDDPLKRKIVSNLVNAYCKDTVDLNRIAKEVVAEFPNDSVVVTFLAEAYKRIQFQIKPDSREELLAYLKGDTLDVKYALHEWYFTTTSVPTDPDFKDSENTWFYKQIGLYNAWNYGYGSDTIIIAVIDDSFDPDHVEFKERFISPWNVMDYSEKVNSNYEMIHGTHVAGTVCANKDNGFGISGVAPNCKVMPIQIADQNGNMSITSIIDGIFYALKNDADIINMSLGQPLDHLAYMSESQQEELAKSINQDEAKMWDEIYEIALKENTIIVQAAGNSAVLASIDPMKRSQSTIVVGALDENNSTASFTNYGSDVDVYAPGVQIFSSMPDGNMGYLDGTSMATPIVSGCIALVRSKDNSISASEIKDLIKKTGTNVNGEVGKMIRVDKLLESI